MADEVFGRDANRVPVIGGVTDDANLFTTALRVDPSSLRLKVTSTATLSNIEYTEGDTDTTITGIPIMWEDTGNTLRAVSAVKPLPIDVISQVPGTGATNLGKAEDATHTSGDTGVAMLGVYRDDKTGISADTVEDYALPHIDKKGRLRVSPGGQHLFDAFVSTNGWEVLNDDTINLTTSTDHVAATGSLSFDKFNGGSDTVFAIIDKTITSISLANIGTGSLFLQAAVNIPTLTNVVNVVIRIGTDDTNYNEWKIPTDDATAGQWQLYRTLIANSVGSTGNGWNLTAITYIAVGVEFSSQSNQLAAILFDSLAAVGGQVNSTDAAAEITSQVSSAKVDLQKINGSVVTKGAGNASNGSQRIVIASDDVNTLKTTNAVEIMDDWDESDRAKVNIIAGQAGIAGGTGADGATVPRVTLATNVALPAGTNAIGKLSSNSGVDIGDVTLNAGTAAFGKLSANSGVDIGDVDVTSLPKSIDGPGIPDIDSYAHIAINLNAGANQVLVSSAANKQIWVYGVSFTLSVAGTVSFQDEDDTAVTGIMDFAANSGLGIPTSGNFSMPIWKLATDKDLEVDIITAAVDGWLDYSIVSV